MIIYMIMCLKRPTWPKAILLPLLGFFRTSAAAWPFLFDEGSTAFIFEIELLIPKKKKSLKANDV